MSRNSLSEIRDDVDQILGFEISKHIDPDVKDRAINKALRTLNMRFEILLSSWYATSVASKCLYKLPLALLRLDRVYFDDTILTYTHRRSLTGVESDLENIQSPTWTEEV